MRRLTQKQEDFIINYLKTGNATRSAISAGYSINGAEVQGSVLLRNIKVKDRLVELQTQINTPKIADIVERKEILSKIAREDIRTEKNVPVRSPNIQATAELNRMEMIGNTVLIVDPIRIKQAVDELYARAELPEGVTDVEGTDV